MNRPDPAPLPVRSRANSPHYRWGEGCDGWVLHEDDALGAIEELVPPGAGETAHRHSRTGQLFFVLEGRARIECDGGPVLLHPGDCLHIPPGNIHRFRNDGDAPVRFLVLSAPRHAWDRIDEQARPPAPSPAGAAASHDARLVPVDSETIAALIRRLPEFERKTTAAEIQQRVTGRHPLRLAALTDAGPIGFIVAHAVGDGAYYAWLVGVLPEHRGHGIASRLLTACEEQAAAIGATVCRVKSMNRYRAMLRLLLARGYDITAVDGDRIVCERRLPSPRPALGTIPAGAPVPADAELDVSLFRILKTMNEACARPGLRNS